MQKEPEYKPIGQTGSAELAAAWAIVVLFAAAVALLGYTAWNSWYVARASEATFAGLKLSGTRTCAETAPAAAATAPSVDCTRKVLDKPGWKIFSQTPIRFQYPEDYRVNVPTPGHIQLVGPGGRLDIQTSYEVAQDCRTGTPVSPAGQGGSFDLKYGVGMRVQIFYAADAKSYDRTILRDVSETITLNR